MFSILEVDRISRERPSRVCRRPRAERWCFLRTGRKRRVDEVGSDAHAVGCAWVEALSKAFTRCPCGGSQGECDDETVETHHTCKNKTQNHAHKELGLVAHCAHSPVTADGSGPARRDARQPARQPCAEVHVAPEGGDR
jgi:hypothetical protein